jgi:outer membrane protein assembly factor BamB/uncharacterized protein YjdB
MTEPIVSYRRWGSCALLLAAVLSGCADSTGAGGAPVAEVEIDGTLHELIVGDSVQLTATLRDAKGRELSGRTVTWASSDTSVVSISQSGVATGRGYGDAYVTATSESRSGDTYVSVDFEEVGSVVIAGMPAGPVPSGTTVQLTATVYTVSGRPVPGAGVAWSTSQYPVASISETGVLTALRDGTTQITATSVGTVTSSFTLVVRDPVASVTMSPPAAVLFVGETVRFEATPRTADGNRLARALAWSTSDPLRATIDSTGTARALATGDVTLTAAVEGRQATAAVRVLARPVADWSQAREWTMYQGNAGHTGYVPVTADPASFHDLWVRSFNGWVDGIIEGGGKVFVAARISTSPRYPTYANWLFALDPATGQTLWSQSLIRWLYPPAYDNGRLYATHGEPFYGGSLHAFDAATGRTVFESRYENNTGEEGYAPVVSGGRVYLASGVRTAERAYLGGLYAFSAADGERSWTAEPSQHQRWTPAVADGRVYAFTGVSGLSLSVYDAANGDPLFQVPDPGYARSLNGSMNNSPVVGGENDVLATQNGRLLSFNLQTRAMGWVRTGSFRGNVTAAEGVLYVINGGQVEARRESDGSLLWAWSPPEGQPKHNLIATRNLLFVTTDTHTYALDLAAHVAAWWYPAAGPLMLTRDGVLVINGVQVTAITLK